MGNQPRSEGYTGDAGALVSLPLLAVGAEVHRQPSLGSAAPPLSPPVAPPTSFANQPAVGGGGESGAGALLPSLA